MFVVVGVVILVSNKRLVDIFLYVGIGFVIQCFLSLHADEPP